MANKGVYWLEHDIIGYVALDEEGKPYRPSRSGYSWQKGLTNPPRVYTTLARALSYSPCNSAAEVRMFTIDKEVE